MDLTDILEKLDNERLFKNYCAVIENLYTE
jgi:hypothetical protein